MKEQEFHFATAESGDSVSGFMLRNFGTTTGYLIGRIGERVSNPNKDLIAGREYTYTQDEEGAKNHSKQLRNKYIVDRKASQL